MTTRICPICHKKIEIKRTDWTLHTYRDNGHAIATIGSAWNAPADIGSAARAQIASNLAAYDLDYDAELNLGIRGTAWVQCPEKREVVTDVTQEKSRSII